MDQDLNKITKNETSKFFNGDKIASDVWYSKYRYGNETSPVDMFKRHINEINNIILEEFTPKYNYLGNIYYNLSNYGRYFFNKLSENSLNFLTENINYNKIILGGSMQAGIGNYELNSSLSNCFVIKSPFDSYAGINKNADQLTQLMKRRGGCGQDLSTIRPKGAIVNNQAKVSAGPVLFMTRYSNITLEVAQDGRRGALMLSLDIKHPDSLEFIKSKSDLSKITGANISIKLDDDFMEAIKNNDDFILRFPIETDINVIKHDFKIKAIQGLNKGYNELETIEDYLGTKVYYKIIKAKEYWDAIIDCAYNTAEPGILFTGNWEKYGLDWNYDRYRPISTNPCSEIPMQAYDSCRLLALNLNSLVDNPFTDNAKLKTDNEIYELFYNQLIIGDFLISLELKHINIIIDNIVNSKEPEDLKASEIDLWNKIKNETISGRRIGAGFLGLADMLASLELHYSAENTIEKIFKIKLQAELDATIDLAILFKPFEGYDSNLEEKSEFISMIKKEFPEQYERMIKYGRRNISWSTGAPTGTISLMAQTTSGIEPLFKPYYTRRKKCIDSNDRVDFIDKNDGQKFTEYNIVHPKFIEWYYIKMKNSFSSIFDTKKFLEDINKNELNKIFELSPWFNNCTEDLNWNDRIKIQAIVQKYTTHAISSTINLPENIDKDVISQIYYESWAKGLKGNTIYRDGSRSGILVNDVNQNIKVNTVLNFKRPDIIPAYYYTIIANNRTYSVIIGLIDNKPYEIFIISGIHNLPIVFDYNDSIKGEITRDFSDWYNFSSETFTIPELTAMQYDEKLISLMLSALFRSKTPINEIIKILEKTKPIAGSFTFKLIKILSNWIDKDFKLNITCSKCGGEIIYEGGCQICKTCGHSDKC